MTVNLSDGHGMFPAGRECLRRERAGEEGGGWCCMVWAAVTGQGQGDDSGDC